MRLCALAFTAFAIVRLLRDTTWVAPPRVLIGDAIAALVCWTIYSLGLAQARRKALQIPGSRGTAR